MLKKLLASQLRINMASSVVMRGTNIIVLAAAYPIYLHYLGYETYGIWLALGAVLGFAQISNLGMAQAVTKLVAEEIGRGNRSIVEKYVATAILILCIAGGTTLAIILIFKSQIISAFKFPDDKSLLAGQLLPYIGILSIYVLIVQVLIATLAGLGRMDISNYIETGGRITLLMIAAPLLHIGYGLKGLFVAATSSQLIMHTLSIFFIRRMITCRVLKLNNISINCVKRLFQIGSGLFGGSVVRMVGIPFNKFMLSRYAGVESLPVFDIAYRGCFQIHSIINVAFRALMPEVSRITSKMSIAAINRIQSIIRKAQRLILLCGVPFYTLLLVFATPLLKIWLGKSFLEIIPLTFRVMLIASFINLLSLFAYHTLVGLGKIKAVFIAPCITWVSDILFILVITIFLNRLSPAIAGLCLIISWAASSSYLIWNYHSTIKHYTRTMSLTDKIGNVQAIALNK